MMVYRSNRALVPALLCGTFVISASQQASATTSWSRKYKIACTACHAVAAMPRLNFYGEEFEENGYQEVDTEDGGEFAKVRAGNTLWDEDFGSLFSLRVQLEPFRYTTNALETPSGGAEDKITLGLVDHFALFFNGSVAKNLALYMNIRFDAPEDSDLLTQVQFYFGWHNIIPRLLNFRIGRQPILAEAAFTARAPMFPGLTIGEILMVRTSNGAGDDSVTTRGGRPALSIFGSQPFGSVFAAYQLAVENGRFFLDNNKFKNVSGTLTFGLREGDFAGSKISVTGYRGKDTRNVLDDDENFTAQNINNFQRLYLAANIRYGVNFDLIFAFLGGKEDNFRLVSRGDREEVKYYGIVSQIGYALTEQWHIGAQYDLIESKNPLFERRLSNKISPVLSFSPIDNIRTELVGRIDLLEENTRHPEKQHEILLTGRAMF